MHRIQQAVGSDALVLTEDSQAYWPFKLVLATRASYLAENGAEATKILGALLKADKYLKDEPEKAHAMFAPHVKLDADDVRRYSAEISYGIRLTPRLVDMIAFEVGWFPLYMPAFYEGKQPVTTDFGKLIAPEYLRNLAPQAVEIE